MTSGRAATVAHLLLVTLFVPLLAKQAQAQDVPLQVIPQMWFSEGGEFLNDDLTNPTGLPPANLVGKFEERITDDNDHYLLTTEFARNDPQAIYVIYLSGRTLKYDFIDKVIDWDVIVPEGLRNAAVAPDGSSVAIATGSNLQLHSTLNGALIMTFESVCNGDCLSVIYSRDSRYLIAGDVNGHAHIIDTTSPNSSWQRKMHEWPLRKLLYIENGIRRFLVTSDGTELILYDLNSDEVRRHMIGNHQDGPFQDFWISALGDVPGTNFFVIGGYSDIHVVDATIGQVTHVYKGATKPLLRAYASPDLSRIIGTSKDHVIYSWHTDSGSIASSHWMETSRLSQFIDMAISTDGKYAAVAALEPMIAFPPRLYNRVRIYSLP